MVLHTPWKNLPPPLELPSFTITVVFLHFFQVTFGKLRRWMELLFCFNESFI
jgi:hypothetical protein